MSMATRGVLVLGNWAPGSLVNRISTDGGVLIDIHWVAVKPL